MKPSKIDDIEIVIVVFAIISYNDAIPLCKNVWFQICCNKMTGGKNMNQRQGTKTTPKSSGEANWDDYLKVFYEKRTGVLWQGKLLTKTILDNAVYPIAADTTTSFTSFQLSSRTSSMPPSVDMLAWNWMPSTTSLAFLGPDLKRTVHLCLLLAVHHW